MRPETPTRGTTPAAAIAPTTPVKVEETSRDTSATPSPGDSLLEATTMPWPVDSANAKAGDAEIPHVNAAEGADGTKRKLEDIHPDFSNLDFSTLTNSELAVIYYHVLAHQALLHKQTYTAALIREGNQIALARAHSTPCPPTPFTDKGYVPSDAVLAFMALDVAGGVPQPAAKRRRTGHDAEPEPEGEDNCGDDDPTRAAKSVLAVSGVAQIVVHSAPPEVLESKSM